MFYKRFILFIHRSIFQKFMMSFLKRICIFPKLTLFINYFILLVQSLSSQFLKKLVFINLFLYLTKTKQLVHVSFF